MAFQLKPNRKETENKTIRFPIPLIEKIDIAISNQEVSFFQFRHTSVRIRSRKYGNRF